MWPSCTVSPKVCACRRWKRSPHTWNRSRDCIRALARCQGENVRRSPRWALLQRGKRRILGVKRNELAHHSVCPAEAVLEGVLTAPAGAACRNHIVFLDELATVAISVQHSDHPAASNRLRQR